MNLTELVAAIENEFDEFKRGETDPDLDISELLEWNSINVILTMSLIKTEFDIDISAKDLKHCTTIRELHKVLIDKKTHST